MKETGYNSDYFKAVWPRWWSEESSSDPTAQAELRFSIARRLGLSPRSLLAHKVEFIWDDKVQFKGLRINSEFENKALVALGRSIARLLIRGVNHDSGSHIFDLSSMDIRKLILDEQQCVNLENLLALYWSLSIPVIQTNLLPLGTKGMDAMVVTESGRFVVILARQSTTSASLAYILAHELGHIKCRHLEEIPIYVDVDTHKDLDEIEREANCFALELLTGNREIEFDENTYPNNADTLAKAVRKVGYEERIEPGTLALCYGYYTGRWAIATSAVKLLYENEDCSANKINSLALQQLDTSNLSVESLSYLKRVMNYTS